MLFWWGWFVALAGRANACPLRGPRHRCAMRRAAQAAAGPQRGGRPPLWIPRRPCRSALRAALAPQCVSGRRPNSHDLAPAARATCFGQRTPETPLPQSVAAATSQGGKSKAARWRARRAARLRPASDDECRSRSTVAGETCRLDVRGERLVKRRVACRVNEPLAGSGTKPREPPVRTRCTRTRRPRRAPHRTAGPGPNAR